MCSVQFSHLTAHIMARTNGFYCALGPGYSINKFLFIYCLLTANNSGFLTYFGISSHCKTGEIMKRQTKSETKDTIEN